MQARADWLWGWVAVLGLVSVSLADPPAYLELSLKEEAHRGKILAMDQADAWLMDRDGKINRLKLKSVQKMEKLSDRFRPLTAAELRDSLQREFGKHFEIAGSEHYLVCAPKGQAREYANLFEGIYRSFYSYFSVRGFRLAKPEFSLVAIVFPDHKSFDAYCRNDGIRAFPGLRGYYLRTSNRVALFDSGDAKTASLSMGGQSHFGGMDAAIEAGLADTMVHEATHQVAFNTGLHNRIGANPKWIVEGLATVFESPGIRDSASRRGRAFERANRERYVWFRNFAKSRRKPNSLAAFVTSDKMFQASALDAYSEAWALSFYLIETRSSKYAKYLKTIATRDPIKDYPAKERLADFQDAFGSDLDLLEADFLRFISRLED